MSKYITIEYIGRPSPLGNPFRICPSRSRDQAIALYREWLDAKCLDEDSPQSMELARLGALASEGHLVLTCWCKPAACHGDYIKELLDSGKFSS